MKLEAQGDDLDLFCFLKAESAGLLVGVDSVSTTFFPFVGFLYKSESITCLEFAGLVSQKSASSGARIIHS